MVQAVALGSDREREEALSAATRWYARLTSDDVSDEDRSSFKAWLEGNDEHRRAYQNLQAMLAEVDQAREFVPRRAVASPPRRARSFATTGTAWLAAAVIVLALAGSWLFQRTASQQTFQTQVAERRSVELEDGSTVLLNARSQITVELGRSIRRVSLDAGEALFEVAPDTTRPFVVPAGGAVIRVVGTQFNARRDPGGTAVTVLEGVVGVAPSSAKRPDEDVEFRQLQAGQQLHYSPDGEPGEVMAVDSAQAVAWREGRLIYRGETFAQVLRDLSRYVPGRELHALRELQDLRVSGTFRLDDIERSLEALEVALPVRQVRLGSEILFVPDHAEQP